MKKIIALLLSVIMLLGLVACGTPADNGETPVAADEFYATASYKDVMANGFGDSRWDGSLPLVAEGEEVTIRFGLPTKSLVLDYETNAYTKWLEETTGINLEIVEFAGSASDIGTQLSLMMTGGEKLPDIIATSGLSKETLKEYLREGYLVNLAGYMQTDAHYLKETMAAFYPDAATHASMMENIAYYCCDTMSEGIFSFPRLFYSPADLVSSQIMINTEWLKAVGKKAPTNIEELYDVLVAFRDQDPNGNGKKDEIPMYGLFGGRGRGIDHYILNAFTYYCAPAGGYQVNDGKVELVYTHDSYREGLKFMNKLIKEGLLSEQVLTASDSDLRSLLNPADGKTFTVGIVAGWIDVDHSETSIFAYEPIAPLADATGKGGWGPWELDSVYAIIVISSQCERPEIAFRLLDFMASGESYLRQRWGEKGVDWDDVPANLKTEGTGMFGGKASFITLQDDTFRKTNNACWHEQYTFASEAYYQMYIDAEENPYKAEVYKKLWQNNEIQRAVGNPEETFNIFWRTEEEDEIYYEYYSEVSSHWYKCRAEFCKGIRDPYDDAAWAQYLKELNQLRINESVLQIAQASYDRSKAAK